MSKIPDKNPDQFNDADIADLFAADSAAHSATNRREPSIELDKAVLANAELSQHDLPKKEETFTQRYAPIFGTAAVLLMAFILTPIIMQSPETSLDQSGVESIAASPGVNRPASESAVAVPESVAADVANNGIVSSARQQANSSGNDQLLNKSTSHRTKPQAAVAQSKARVQASSDASPVARLAEEATPDAESIASESANSLSSQASDSNSQSTRTRPENYRETAVLWVTEIKHLYEEEKFELAREELTDFREKFPDNTNERLLPEALREEN